MKPSVLIVEDERYLNEAYQMILSAEGYPVRSVYDGQEALEAIEKEMPKLILLDLRMPKLDGLGFLRKAKLDSDTKVIVFTNYDDQKEIETAYAAGAHRYMLKAWATPKELTRFVAETLAEE